MFSLGFSFLQAPVTDKRRYYCDKHCIFMFLSHCYKRSILCLHINVMPKKNYYTCWFFDSIYVRYFQLAYKASCTLWFPMVRPLRLVDDVQQHLKSYSLIPLKTTGVLQPSHQAAFKTGMNYFEHSRREDAEEVPRRNICKPSSLSLVLAMLFLICITESCEHRLGCRSIFFEA